MKKLILIAALCQVAGQVAGSVALAETCPDFNSTVSDMKGQRYEYSQFGVTPASVVAWATVCPIEQITWLQPDLCDLRISSWKTIVAGARSSAAAGESNPLLVTQAQARLDLALKTCGK